MSVSIIVAMAENLTIGRENDLPWKLPNDLKRFKELTSGKTVIMGRKCYESIPPKFRPLPNRVNVILTRDENYVAEGCEVRHNLKDAISEFNDPNNELFIIGGSEIYKESFSLADKLYLTRILQDIEGDVKLEGLEDDKWLMESFEGPFKENELDYRFENYIPTEAFVNKYK